jgi:hypothetical protein
MAGAKRILILLILLAPFGASAFSSLPASDVPQVQLDVAPVRQSERYSCGEAAITIVYNHARPDNPMTEATVLDYARMHELYTPHAAPFTSPADMVSIAQAFAGPIRSGHVSTADDGLALLAAYLQAGQPVIIDVTTRLDRLESGAHFVVVTGLGTDPWTGRTRVTYINPLNAAPENAAWDGDAGIWNAWQNNGDPGGSGWWLVISMAGMGF